jgi:SAM-dependent methyltransferase
LAIDLGCGPGIEAIDLLSHGWQVLALDRESDAIDWLTGRVPSEHQDRLTATVVGFESVELPAADLVWAGLSLPFCPPDVFPTLWGKIVAALRPGGRFAGDFFGDRSDRQAGWINAGGMTFLSRAQVMALIPPLRLEYFIEEEGERPMALSGPQQFHSFGVVARRP